MLGTSEKGSATFVRRVLTLAAAACFVVLLAANIYLIAARLIFKDALPKVFGFAPLAVASGSMQPAIDVGDLIIIREQKDYEVNDIVTYTTGRSIVTHRIVQMDGSNAVVKGDANNVADGSVPVSSIEGKMVLRIPRIGDAMFLARTPIGMLVVIAGVILLGRAVLTVKS